MRHKIELEEILPAEPKKKYPICIDGKRNCPPEDYGGIWGYEEFLAAIKDSEHEEHESMLDWVGGSFDPEEFDPNRVIFDDPKERRKFLR